MPLPPSLLAPTVRLERVATGAAWSEGPLWLPRLGVLRWSDIPNDRILEYRPSDHSQRVHRDQVEFTNGRTLDLDGRVVQCSHGRRRLEWDNDPAPIGIVDRWNGARLNSPNDVVVARDGAIWFSDAPYGITQPNERHRGVREYGDHCVFRHDVPTALTTAVVVDVEEPNGLAFSPGEDVLYVADSSAVRRPHGVGNHHIRTYDVIDRRRCKNGRVFTPDGEELGGISVPELVGNLCFGGPDGTGLYVAASTSIYRIPTEVRDAAQHS
jgi:gluconolactonase